MKPSIPRGTRDFGPAEMQKRLYILDIIRKNFKLFGFEPIETPAMENLTTLLGKYGDEGDKLVYKIRSNKNLAANLSSEQAENIAKIYPHWLPQKSDKGLRYDLTVPFARYVVMNQSKLVFPFKRYQIQPVWRGDNPQKGRYREFYQCDADVIGSNSLINEIELIQLIDKVFTELRLNVTIKVNNRKILAGIVEYINQQEKLVEIITAIDKLEKISLDDVNEELRKASVSEEAIQKLQPFLKSAKKGLLEKVTDNKYGSFFEEMIKHSEIGERGSEELAIIEDFFKENKLKTSTLELDFTLARGLNYYTGAIFEVKSNDGTLASSILGGGRYDDLTGIFGLPNTSGVGISFGVDRIYDVMEELNLFPENISRSASCTVLFTHFDAESQHYCLHLAAELRKNEIACEIYPDLTKKLGKQLDYANKKNIPFVCTVGSNEIEKGAFSIKHMSTGNKQELNITDMIHYIKTELHAIHH